MGGFGSGRWLRHGTRRTLTEDVPRIDIRDLKKQHSLTPGTVGLIECKSSSPESTLVICRAANDGILITHAPTSQGCSNPDFSEHVELDFTPCNFGGKRAWFKCPKCGSRAALLYVRDRGLRCRCCYNLAYRTQAFDEMDRVANRARNIRIRLGGSGSLWDPAPEKPKGMHFVTYWRLLQKLIVAERKFWRIVAQKTGDLFG